MQVATVGFSWVMLLVMASLLHAQVEIVGDLLGVRIADGAELPRVDGTAYEPARFPVVLAGSEVVTGEAALSLLFEQAGCVLHLSPGTRLTLLERADALLELRLAVGRVQVVRGGAIGGALLVSTPEGLVEIAASQGSGGGAMVVCRVVPGQLEVTLAAGGCRVTAEREAAGVVFSGMGGWVSLTGESDNRALSAGGRVQTSRVDGSADLAIARVARAGVLVAGTGERINVVTDELAGASLLGPQPRQAPSRVPSVASIPPQALTRPPTVVVLTSVSGAGTGVVQGTAQSASAQLLASGNPASIIVALRLERTRVIGAPGSGGQAGAVAANPNATIPFLLRGLSR